MSSLQLCNPLLQFGGIPTSSSSSSSSASNSSSINLPISMPNGLPSGLSVTITPASAANASSSAPATATTSSSSSSLNASTGGGLTITKSSSSASNNPSSNAPTNLQQQQLRALASTLQSMTSHYSNLNLSNVASSGPSLNQATLLAAASKMMEVNPIDDLVMQEVTQRLFKMNQELWQQAGVSAAVLSAAGGNPTTAQPTNLQSGGQRESNPAISGSTLHQVNEMKIAEKLVSELAAQQSTRNAFHLNERSLQECWNTLQRVSCMIFMHKSAMQLQQQAAAQAVHGGGTSGHGHGLIRAGSVSSNTSENGQLSKPHQCQQCLKSFSSNHQLVQHIRVHTGEKPYKCSYCDRRFKQLSHVQQHTRLHTGERPYKCHVHDCGRAFIQLSNLQQHLRNHDAQLERSKNRPFHCGICGKGFATESSLRTHTTKVCKDQHAALIGGPNAVTCPICHKLFMGGEALMDHMKHTHKDPNASGVATKRRTANHPCPICGKHYVNEGSLRKHLTCHPETAQLTTSLRMWPCSVCQAVFTHETGLLTHMDQMRMDPKHQFAAQYVLSRAAAERRERDNILTAAAVAAMTGNHSFGAPPQGQPMPPVSLMPMMPPSPSGSESSGRLSSPLDTNNSGLSSASVLQHTRMSSPVNSPLDARINSGSINNNMPNNNTANHLNNHHQMGGLNSGSANNSSSQQDGRKEFMSEKYEAYEKPPHNLHHNHHLENNMAAISREHHQVGMNQGNPHGHAHHMENGPLSNKYQMAEQAAMKMAALLGQGHGHGHGPGPSQNDLRNFIQHQANSQMHSQEMMQAEGILRSQAAAEAIRLAVSSSERSGNNGSLHNSTSSINNSGNGPPSNNGGGHNSHSGEGNLGLNFGHQHEIHRGNPEQNGHRNSMHNSALSHQLNSLLNQQDLSEALLRQFDASRTLGFPLSALNS